MDFQFDLMPDSEVRRRSTKPLTKSAKKNKKRNEKKKQVLLEQQKANPLPVKNHAKTIADKVRENQVVIITAETGCGKSSQVPQILLRDVLDDEGIIVCTQPRRVAAWSLAARVAEEMGVKLGEKVGYHVRFDRNASDSTQIKYMTDGILLRECLFNEEMIQNNYSIIIIDEVHERSIQMDLLLGFMKMMLPKHKELKLVIMSATMNTDNLSHYFDEAPVLRLEGSLNYHVDICYKPGFTNAHVLSIIIEIINTYKEGDILVFLPGEPEIGELETELNKLGWPLCVLPAHSQLPHWKLERIFDPPPDGHRKIVLSTNLAESSITVDGLRFVVDTGYVNVKVFDGKTGINWLETRLISKSEAQQRRGRVGRTSRGFCYRLYKREQLYRKQSEAVAAAAAKEEEEEEEEKTERCFQEFPTPQIEREDLAHLVLMLKWTNFEDVDDFPWLTFPNPDNVAAAKRDLRRLEALDSDFNLTDIGRHIVKFPLHPRMAAVILKSAKRGCQYGALLLASILSLFCGGRQRSLVKLARSRYEEEVDEAAVFISIMHEFVFLEKHDNETTNEVQNFASHHGIAAYNIFEAVHIFKQLVSVLKTCGYSPPSTSRPSLVKLKAIGEVLTQVFESNIGEQNDTSQFKLRNGLFAEFRPTLNSLTSKKVPKSVGCTELFRLKDIRKQRKDLGLRLINTFVPKTQL